MNNTFIWADLSTFDIQSAKRFYSQCFDWEFDEVDDSYISCQAQQSPTAGLYTMPEKFQRIGMPSFWMSYIRVEGIQEVVRVAELQGAKIEIKPQPAPGGGLIALIRDPAGAGFTVYEGEELTDINEVEKPGRIVWNELHVSELAKIETFYTSVFKWRIVATDISDRYHIFLSTDDSKPIAGIQVTSNDIKGSKEYWGVYFAIKNISTATRTIEKNGGKIVAEQPLGNRQAMLAYDSQDAAFYIVEVGDKSYVSDHDEKVQTPKWRAILGLLIVAIAVLTEANWVWGILFLIWVVPDVRRGSTHFLEYVERSKNPVVYWLIIATWLALSVFILIDAVIGS